MMVRWSYKAQKQQDAIANYIYKEFGSIALREFYQKIDDVESELLTCPEMGKLEPLLKHRTRAYRSIVLNKRSKLIYTIEKDYIYISALWDTRREPKAQASKLR